MNKIEELIQKYKILESKSRPNCLGDSFNRGEASGTSRCCFEIISDLEQLDEPKKVVVPKFVADFIEDGNRNDKIAFLVHQKYLGVNSLMRECPVKDWLRSVDYKTVLSLVNGYEVEKEQLYYVELTHINYDGLEAYLMKTEYGIDIADNNDFDDMKFTESEIKAIDERYWAFAVKVED